MSIMAFRTLNFMGFQDSDWVELRPITLLFGRNSTGKSAFLKALRLLKQSLDSRPNQDPLILSAENGVDLGSYKDLVHKHQEDLDIGFAFKCSISSSLLGHFKSAEDRYEAVINKRPLVNEEEAWAILELSFGLPTANTRSVILKQITIYSAWSAVEGQDKTRIFLAEWQDKNYDWRFESDFLREHERISSVSVWPQVKDFRADWGFLPILKDFGGELSSQSHDFATIRGILFEFRDSITSFLTSLAYLGPLRSEPQRFYYVPPSSTSYAESHGENTVHSFLSLWLSDEWQSKLDQINENLRILDLSVRLVPKPLDSGRGVHEPMFELQLQELDMGGISASLRDVGFGL